MPSLFDTLHVMGNALFAQQTGAQVASNNISNVNTPGYHRQEVLLAEVAPGLMGVRVADIRRITDSFINRQAQVEAGSASFADGRSQLLGRLEDVFGDLGEGGVGAALNRFFAGFRELAVSPNDSAARGTVLAGAEDLAQSIRRMAAQLEQLQQDEDQRVVYGVAEVNGLTAEIADLNRAIKEQESYGSEVQGLLDRRDAAVERLGELLGATSFVADKGDVTVQVGGVSLVQGDVARTITAVEDGATGLHRLQTDDGAQIDIGARIQSGELGAALVNRDQTLATRRAELDTFAADLITAVNTAHRAGTGLDGLSGRDLFVPPATVAGAAAGMALDPSIAGNPDGLAAASDPLALPGDGRNAQAIAQLEEALVSGGGTLTPIQGLASLVASVGQEAKSAYLEQQRAGARLEQVANLREQVSGVSIQEQMLALTRFQRAFQAASKVVTTVDAMIETVLTLKG